MLRILATAFESIPQDVIDAARNLGAGRLALVREMLVPMVMPGLFAGSVFTFITSLEEFNLTFVIGTPTFQTIPTVLFDYLGYHFIRTNAAVVSIILLVPSIALLFITERFLKTRISVIGVRQVLNRRQAFAGQSGRMGMSIRKMDFGVVAGACRGDASRRASASARGRSSDDAVGQGRRGRARRKAS